MRGRRSDRGKRGKHYIAKCPKCGEEGYFSTGTYYRIVHLETLNVKQHACSLSKEEATKLLKQIQSGRNADTI